MDTPFPASQINVPPGFIDLGLGDPPFALLPLDLIRRAAEGRLGEGDPSFLQYGAEQGDSRFRASLADFLCEGYGVPVHAADLFVTNGVSNALDLVCTLFTRPGDTIFVEEPSYFLALRIFRDHGLRAVPVPTDEHGLVIEALEDLLAVSRPKFVYIIPTFQNPTGRTLPEERRERLIGLANTHDFLVVADEVYHFLSYTGQPPKPLAGRAGAAKVLSLGSFSKILAPGLRLGWIQAGPAELQRLVGAGVLDSGGGLNPFTSAIVGRAIESGGLRQNIASLIDVYRQRVAFMDACLRKYLPGVAYAVPAGGYFFWVRLPENMDAAALQQRAEAFKVNFRPGVRFSSQDGLRDYLRLCYVFYGPEQIEEGIARLKQTLEAV